MNAERKLAGTMSRMWIEMPFFACLCERMPFVAAPGVTDTMATDGARVFYNPRFVEESSDDDLLFVVAHEGVHAANGHCHRRNGRDPDLWNDACDFAVNVVLVDCGRTLPEGGLFDPGYRGMSAEEVYSARRHKQEQEQEQDDSDDDTDDGDDGDDDDTDDGDDGDDDDTDDTDDTDDGDDGDETDTDDDDDTDDGDETDTDDDEPQHTGRPGGVLDAPDDAPDADEWAQALESAALVTQSRGLMPGGAEAMIENARRPRFDWRAELRRFMQDKVPSDYTWTRPNQRYTASGYYLPSMRTEELGEVVVCVDTSGSTGPCWAQFMEEVRSIINDLQPRQTTFLQVDARVQDARTFQRGETIEIERVRGGGGTSFVPAFDYVTEHGLQPACLVYLTDLEGDAPAAAPDYPVLWISTTRLIAPWGETVYFDNAR